MSIRLKNIYETEIVMQSVIRKIEENKIIVIVRGIKKEHIIPLAEAMYNGGIRLIECTYDASGRVNDEQTASYIKMLAEHFGDKMAVGAGTVLTEKQVELTCAAGGSFIISPDVNAAVIKKTKSLGLISMPGALTPSEVTEAHRAGADFVKLFPLDSFGPSYIKALKAPLSHIKFLAVGGINADNMNDYLAAGAVGVGVGSGIVNKAVIEAGDFDTVTALAKKYTANIK